MNAYAYLIPVFVSLALYGTALFLPALQFAARPPVKGITTLLWGWWGVPMFDFPWLANIAYFIAVVQLILGKRPGALKFAIAAAVLGLLSLRVKAWYFNEAEGTPVKSLGSAFYCWMASFLALFVVYVFPKA